MSLRFVPDEHMPTAVAEGSRRRGIDVVMPSEVGLRQQPDTEYLRFAVESRRVILTQDADFVRHHYGGASHFGIAFSHQGMRSIGEIISRLVVLHDVLAEDKMIGQIEYT